MFGANESNVLFVLCSMIELKLLSLALELVFKLLHVKIMIMIFWELFCLCNGTIVFSGMSRNVF
jgi:hypothetical protein